MCVRGPVRKFVCARKYVRPLVIVYAHNYVPQCSLNYQLLLRIYVGNEVKPVCYY